MEGEKAWFCVRTQPKHEHVAAAYLSKELGLELFVPRIRFKKSTRRGPVWFTEALFPNYLFARFELGAAIGKLHHARGVQGVVHFGNCWPAVPDAVVAELKATVGAEEVHTVAEQFEIGETVTLSGGAFHEITGLVTRVIPSRQRVAVLLEFLGRQTMLEVSVQQVVRENERVRVARG